MTQPFTHSPFYNGNGGAATTFVSQRKAYRWALSHPRGTWPLCHKWTWFSNRTLLNKDLNKIFFLFLSSRECARIWRNSSWYSVRVQTVTHNDGLAGLQYLRPHALRTTLPWGSLRPWTEGKGLNAASIKSGNGHDAEPNVSVVILHRTRAMVGWTTFLLRISEVPNSNLCKIIEEKLKEITSKGRVGWIGGNTHMWG